MKRPVCLAPMNAYSAMRMTRFIRNHWLDFSYCPMERRSSSALQPLSLCIPTRSPHKRLPIQLNTRNHLPHLILLLLLHNLLLILFIITPLIFSNRTSNKPPRNPQNQDEPKYIDGLQSKQQCKSDDLRDPAFVLLGFPVEFVGADGAEGG
jgi:hypothetical protein